MDLGYCRQHDLVFADALAVRYNMPYNPERDTERKMDVGLHPGAHDIRYRDLLFVCVSCKRTWILLKLTECMMNDV